MENLSFVLILGLAVRLAGALQWALLLFWVRRREEHGVRHLLFQAFAVAIVGYLLSKFPFIFGAPIWVAYLFLVGAYACAPLLYLCTLAFFDDEFRPSPGHALLLAAAIVLPFLTHHALPTAAWLYALLEPVPAFKALFAFIMPQLVTVVFAVWSLYEVWAGRGDDLVETRIAQRLIFIRAIAFTAVFVTLIEYASRLFPALLLPLDILPTTVVFVIGYLLTRHLQGPGGSMLSPLAKVAPELAALPKVPTPHLDENAQRELRRLLESEKVFTRADMNLENLSRLLRLPDYRVRRHINQELGYQNFHQFLNRYRVEEAKRVLSSPAGKEIPLYNLSQDLGYGSQVSFNRAFKDLTGLTPSQFRSGG